MGTAPRLRGSMRCGEASFVKQDEDALHAITQHCRSWGCDICHPRRQAELAGRGEDGRPTALLTLTSNPQVGKDPTDRAKLLVHAWRMIRRRAVKKWPKERLPFLAVFEACKSGEPHLHILTRFRFIPYAWLRAQMAELNGAPVLDVQPIRSRKGASRYVAKYCGKEPHHFGTLKRYWASHGWRLTQRPDEPPLFDINGRFLRDERNVYCLQGWLEDCGWGTTITRNQLWGWAHAPPF